ncbi:hypothetical protein AQBE111736_14025 [Aquirufa beregesia]
MAAPAFTVTLPLVTAVPVTGVKVKVPVPEVPVKIITLVKLATPLTNRPKELITFPPTKPEMLPVKVDVTVILFVAALKFVTALPYASWAVKVFVPVKAVPFV